MQKSINRYIKRISIRTLRWLLTLRGGPNAIAGGFALGIIIAFTPTVGFQMAIALALATLLNLNQVAAVVPVWISNPLTIIPIYTFTYWIGSQFLSHASPALVAEKLKILKEAHSLKEKFASLLSLGFDVFAAMTIGSLIIGIPLGIAGFYFIMSILNRKKRFKKLV